MFLLQSSVDNNYKMALLRVRFMHKLLLIGKCVHWFSLYYVRLCYFCFKPKNASDCIERLQRKCTNIPTTLRAETAFYAPARE